MFSAKNRNEIIAQMNNASFDLLIIGGGITGAGIALDASARGLKVALIEMQDFCIRNFKPINQINSWWITLFKTVGN